MSFISWIIVIIMIITKTIGNALEWLVKNGNYFFTFVKSKSKLFLCELSLAMLAAFKESIQTVERTK